MFTDQQQLPIGNGQGTLVLGDITIVQNHNFGAGNPQQMQMAMMQQQLALHHQQTNAMINTMILGMASQVANQNKILQLVASGNMDMLLDNKLGSPQAEEPMILLSDKDVIIKHESEGITIDGVEYEITDETCEKKYYENNSVLTPKHMKKFFDADGNITVEYNQFIKVPEDTKTFAIIIDGSALKNISEWRDVFRDAYISTAKSTFKTQDMKLLTSNEANYIVIVTNGLKRDIAFITKSNNITENDCFDYVKDIGQHFNSVYFEVAPVVKDGAIDNVNGISGMKSQKVQCLFSTGYYVVEN